MQQFRYDIGWQLISGFTNANYGSGRGLELVPVDRVEPSVSAPPYLTHTKPGVNDGIGDMAFLFKYRVAAGNRENGNYVVTAMLTATVPTGTYTNGAKDALLTPTLAVGKGGETLTCRARLGSPCHGRCGFVGDSGGTQCHGTVPPVKVFLAEVEVNSTMWASGQAAFVAAAGYSLWRTCTDCRHAIPRLRAQLGHFHTLSVLTREGDEFEEHRHQHRDGGAQSILANAIRALATEQISLSDALGRIAAETIVAEGDLVPYARSAMDGYASGGASVGERDLVKSELEGMGAEFELRRVAMRPGKPFAFGWWRDLPVCVLPGNPTAAFVCFQEFVRPALLRMAGSVTPELPTVKAILTGRARSKAGCRYAVLSRLSMVGSQFLVRPLENQCSVLVRNPAMANGLIVLPEGPATYDSGDDVTVQVLDWESAVKQDTDSVLNDGSELSLTQAAI